ncbi:MAG: T9SS type A sorting domain-containing protein [Chitinophagales bacterium]|nr:T9SS type A sorting domain-containing protein [Chitinophagales bacterium]MDW8427869.1 T9SS type A sorting domain-containing protein [Chitinophagales bacterium]
MRIVFLLVLFNLKNALGQNTFYWLPGANQLASDPLNWRLAACNGPTGQIPGALDTVVFGHCSPAQNCTLDMEWTVGRMVIQSDYTASFIVNTSAASLTILEAECYGGTFHGGSATINIEKKLIIDGCHFIATAETLSVKEEFQFLSGVFEHNAGTVVLKKGSGPITRLMGDAMQPAQIVFHKLHLLASGNFGTRFHFNYLNVFVLQELKFAGVKPLFLATASNASFVVEGSLINENDQCDTDTLWFRFTGGQLQSIQGSYPLLLHRMEINKDAGFLQLLTPVEISGEVLFTKGFVVCDSVNALTFLQDAEAVNSGGHGFVRGPVKKIGSKEFLFPIGDGWRYRPMKITPADLPTDAFMAYYGYGAASFGTQAAAPLTYVSRCEYWALHRIAGNAAVSVRLFYDSITCDIDSLPTLRIARWNKAQQFWESTGPAHISGTLAKGSIITTTFQQAFGFFTLAKESPIPTINAGADLWVCAGTTVTLGGQPTASGGTPPYTFHWSPALNLDSTDISNPKATVYHDIDYVLTVTDEDDAVVTDTIRIKVHPMLKAEAGADRFVSAGIATLLGGPPTGGKAPFTYQWQPADYLSQTNIQQPTATPWAHTTYTLTVTDANGCASTDQVTVLVNMPIPPRAATFALFAADSVLSLQPLLINGRVGSRTFVSATIRSTDSIVIRRNLDSLAHADLIQAIAEVKNLNAFSIDGNLNGQQLGSGIYEVKGTATLSDTLMLNGDARSFVVIRITDSLLIQNGATLHLNGIHRQQVMLLAAKGIYAVGEARLPAIIISEKNISGGTIYDATLLARGKIRIEGGTFSPASHGIALTNVSRSDAADWFGVNSSTIEQVGVGFPSHWAHAALRRNLPLLNPRVLRFPPGGKAKSWNANDGWYLDPEEKTDPTSLIYDDKLRCTEIIAVTTLEAQTLPVNRMLEFRQVLTGNDAAALYVANLFTKTDFQIHIIRHMLDLGLKLNFVELGNEFYLRGQTCGFRTAADYAAAVNNYLNILHNTPGLDHLRIGIVASAFSTEDGMDIDTDCRRLTWNAELVPLLSGFKPGDALTFHLYPKCGLPNSQAPWVALSDVPTVIHKAYQETEDFRNHEMKILLQYPQLEAWVTEYNLTDPQFIIHGSWLHGLYMSLFTLRLLEMPKVKFVTAQTMANNAARGMFFVDNRGYVLNEGWKTIGTDVPTQPWGLTAQGLMLKLISDAMRHSTKATLLQFNQVPLLANSSFPVLYGWTFEKDLGDKQSILINLSDQPVLVDISRLAPYSAMEQIASANPLLFVTGHVYHPNQNAIFTGVHYDYSSGITIPSYYDSVHVNLPANTISLRLPPYSVTRLYVLNPTGVWIRQSGASVCAPDPLSPVPDQATTAVNLYVSGGARFEWSAGWAACPQQSSISVSPPASVNLTVKVYDPAGTLLAQKSNISITILPLPTLNVTPSSFNNAIAKSSTFLATASGAVAYNWNPSIGLSSISGPSVQITPMRSRKYFVIGIGSNQCTRLAALTTEVEPSLQILEFGGTLTKDVYPPTTKICKGAVVHLLADTRADRVRWLSAEGTVLAEGPSYTLVGARNMLIIAEATNTLLSATSRRSLWVEVLPTVEPEHSDVFGCANSFIQIKANIKESNISPQFAWDDQLPGTMIYEKKNLSKPVQENVFSANYDPVFFYGPSGTYALRLRGKDLAYSVCPGVENDSVVHVWVSDVPSVTVNSTPCVISGGTTSLMASGASSYTWMGQGLQGNIGAAIEVTPSQTTTYNVVGVNQLCCSSAAVEVQVEQFTAWCDSSSYCHGCFKKTVHVTPYDPNSYSYQWYVNDVPISGATGASHTVVLLGFRNRTATVYCAVSKLDGSCSPGRTNSVKMTLARSCRYARHEVPQTPEAEQYLRIYPNPADHAFVVDFHQPDAQTTPCWLTIYDLSGTIRLRQWLNLDQGRLTQQIRTSLQQGTYLVQVCTAEGCTAEQLIIAR